MNARIFAQIILCVSLLVSGCGPMTESVILGDYKPDAKPPSSDILIIAGEPDQPYREIALFEIKKRSWIPMRPPSSYKLHTQMKLKAAKLGADAVIRVEYEQDRLRATTTALGTAVAFTDKKL